MADVNIKLKRSERSKKFIRKYGPQVYIEMGLKGAARVKELMLERII